MGVNMENTYFIAYRIGGTASCKWRKVLEVYATRQEALDKAHEIEHMGYKTRIFTRHELEVIGLPIGWEAGCVNWDKDSITVTPYETHWKAA
jgi:hypothetical protein